MIFGGIPAPQPEDPPVDDDKEYRKILNWRIDYLMGAGYDAEAAVLIAKHLSVDIHEAGDLLSGGCPTDTALRILL